MILAEEDYLYRNMPSDSVDLTLKRPPLSLPFYYGWFVLSLCFLTILTSAGVRSSPSVLIHPLEAEFGWSRALIASAISMNLLLFGVASPISGWLIDRYGPRKVMLGSLGFLIVGVSGTMAMNQFWQFFLVWGVIVGLGAGGVGSVLTATVGNRWFVARRGLALGILGSASSTGQIIFLPLFMAMITYAGWRMGSMALIVVALILLPLIYLFMRDDPSEIGALWSRAVGSRELRRRGVVAWNAVEERFHHTAGSGARADFLAACGEFLCMRRNRQWSHRHSSYSA